MQRITARHHRRIGLCRDKAEAAQTTPLLSQLYRITIIGSLKMGGGEALNVTATAR